MAFILRVVFTQKASGVKDYDVIDSIRNVKKQVYKSIPKQNITT